MSSPAPPPPPSRRWRSPAVDWRPKARWLAAEIVVVVAGVLIALALDAWWQDRQAEAQERVYLHQLAADLEVTANRLEQSEAAMQVTMRRASNLLIAFTDPDGADRDSVTRWVAWVVWYQRPGLALGVARSLTSDLSVVSDDSVRTAIFGLLTQADAYRAFDEATFDAFIDYSNQLRPFAPMSARIRTYLGDPWADSYYSPLPFEPDQRVAYSLDVDSFLRSREAYVVIDGLYDMAADLRAFQSGMLNRVREVQDVLAERGIRGEAEEDR